MCALAPLHAVAQRYLSCAIGRRAEHARRVRPSLHISHVLMCRRDAVQAQTIVRGRLLELCGEVGL